MAETKFWGEKKKVAVYVHVHIGVERGGGKGVRISKN